MASRILDITDHGMKISRSEAALRLNLTPATLRVYLSHHRKLAPLALTVELSDLSKRNRNNTRPILMPDGTRVSYASVASVFGISSMHLYNIVRERLPRKARYKTVPYHIVSEIWTDYNRHQRKRRRPRRGDKPGPEHVPRVPRGGRSAPELLAGIFAEVIGEYLPQRATTENTRISSNEPEYVTDPKTGKLRRKRRPTLPIIITSDDDQIEYPYLYAATHLLGLISTQVNWGGQQLRKHARRTERGNLVFTISEAKELLSTSIQKYDEEVERRGY